MHTLLPQIWDSLHGLRYNDGLEVERASSDHKKDVKKWHDEVVGAVTAPAKPIRAASANCEQVGIKSRIRL